MIGFQELLVILFIILLIFGGKNIPEIARNLGKCLGAFKKGTKELEEEVNKSESSAKSSANEENK